LSFVVYLLEIKFCEDSLGKSGALWENEISLKEWVDDWLIE
jgi:hypothetical protein